MKLSKPGSRLVASVAAAMLSLLLIYPFGHQRFYGDDFLMLYQTLHAGAADWLRLTFFGAMRPTLLAYFHLCAALSGTDESAYHLVSAGVFALSAGLFVYWLYGLTHNGVVAAVGGLVFLTSPGGWSTVCWPAANGEVLAGLFLVATMIAFDAYMRQPRALFAAGVLVLGALALGSKETMMVLPLLLALRALQEGERRRGLALAGLLAVFAVLLYVPAVQVLQTRAAPQPHSGVHDVHQFVVCYLGDLAALVFTPLKLEVAPAALPALYGATVALLVLLWSFGRRHSLATFGLAWTLLVLLPPTLVWSGHRLYVRYLYLAGPGLGVLVAATMSWLLSGEAASAGQEALARQPASRVLLVAAVGYLVYLRLLFWSAVALSAASAPVAPALRPLPAAVEKHVRSARNLFVFQRPDTDADTRAMAALSLHLPTEKVQDLLDATTGNSAWSSQSCALVLDVGNDRWVDVTPQVDALQRLRQPGPASNVTLQSWGAGGSPWRDWLPWRMLSAVATDAEIGLKTRGVQSALLSPRLRLNPLSTLEVVLRMRFPDVPRDSIRVRLDWATDALPFFDTARSLEQSLTLASGTANGWETVSFFPGENPRWWTGGIIRWLRVHPFCAAGKVSIAAISVRGVDR